MYDLKVQIINKFTNQIYSEQKSERFNEIDWEIS